jgi:PPP family 3-phenylpropionic acid transporter
MTGIAVLAQYCSVCYATGRSKTLGQDIGDLSGGREQVSMLRTGWSARLSPGWLGGLFYFGFYGAAGAYMPFLSVFYAHQGLTGGEIGLLSAIGPVAALLLTPILAALADHRGWRVRLLSVALAGTALVLLLLPLPRTFLGLVPVVALLAVVTSPLISIADSLIAPMALRGGLNFGSMRLWGSVSWAVVATIGGALWQQVGLVLMFPLASLLFVATILVVRLLPEERAVASPATRPVRRVGGDRRFYAVLVATFMVGLGMAMTQTFSGIYIDRLSGQLLLGVFAGVAAISELPLMHWSGRIVRRLGGPRTLLLSYALMGGAYLALALIQQPVLLLSAALLRGLGFGLFLPTTVRLIAGWAPAGRAATYQSLLNAGLWGLAPLLAGPFGGLIYDTSGPANVFLICAGTAALAGLVLIVAQFGGVFPRVAPTTVEATAAGPTSMADGADLVAD